MNIAIRVITSSKEATVVEHTVDGVPVRRIVPTHTVSGKEISSRDFDMGMPYGVELTDIIPDIVIPASKLIDQFHKVGLWTAQDFISRPKEVIDAIYASIGITWSTITNKIKTSTKEM